MAVLPISHQMAALPPNKNSPQAHTFAVKRRSSGKQQRETALAVHTKNAVREGAQTAMETKALRIWVPLAASRLRFGVMASPPYTSSAVPRSSTTLLRNGPADGCVT